MKDVKWEFLREAGILFKGNFKVRNKFLFFRIMMLGNGEYGMSA